MPSALGSNASGSAAAAFLATPMSLTLAVPSVGIGAVFASAVTAVSNDAPPGSVTLRLSLSGPVRQVLQCAYGVLSLPVTSPIPTRKIWVIVLPTREIRVIVLPTHEIWVFCITWYPTHPIPVPFVPGMGI